MRREFGTESGGTFLSSRVSFSSRLGKTPSQMARRGRFAPAFFSFALAPLPRSHGRALCLSHTSLRSRCSSSTRAIFSTARVLCRTPVRFTVVGGFGFFAEPLFAVPVFPDWFPVKLPLKWRAEVVSPPPFSRSRSRPSLAPTVALFACPTLPFVPAAPVPRVRFFPRRACFAVRRFGLQ